MVQQLKALVALARDRVQFPKSNGAAHNPCDLSSKDLMLSCGLLGTCTHMMCTNQQKHTHRHIIFLLF